MMARAPLAFVALAALAACTPQGGGAPNALPALHSDDAQNTLPAARYIKHVVILIQENRTFDNIFAGFPGADTRMYGYTHKNAKVVLQPIAFHPEQDMVHNFTPAVDAVNGSKMNGFDLVEFDDGRPAGTYPYSYLERSEVAPYWTMAKTYTLADHLFPTELGPSFTSHLALIAGTTSLSVDPDEAEADVPTNSPWGCDAPPNTSTSTVNAKRVVSALGPFPCFNEFHTMADILDGGNVSWKYYAPKMSANYGGALWTTFDAISEVRYGPDWAAHMVTPQTTILTDAAKGRLASVTWVVPDWKDSDHPAAESDTGPSWVASVVNAIGKGPQWKTTAIFIVWDDWGGWYDNVPPPQLDYRGLGIRVPYIIVSPYARAHHVVHTKYEFGSILKFIEQTFGLPPIGSIAQGYTDQRATSIAGSFDFTRKPHAFVPIAQRYPAEYFLTRPPSGRPVDTQ
jgi:phospholipase C